MIVAYTLKDGKYQSISTHCGRIEELPGKFFIKHYSEYPNCYMILNFNFKCLSESLDEFTLVYQKEVTI